MWHDQSRLLLTSVVDVLNPATGKRQRQRFVDIRYRVTETSADDKMVVIDASRHWGHYGLKYLNDARNWWVIADLSNVVDAFEELESATAVRVPSIQRFLFRVLAGSET